MRIPAVHEVLEPRLVPLGGPRAMMVQRTLPGRTVRTIGPWCFVDYYHSSQQSDSGEQSDSGQQSGVMDVPPHPHTGLQTVSWLLDGEVLHHDSIGSRAVIRPGELNLMTSGRGIAHSEESTQQSSRMHGVQLWVALPDAHRHQRPHFEHHADLPQWTDGTARATVLMGSVGSVTSPALAYSPIVGAHVTLPAESVSALPLEPEFEHAVLLLTGGATADGVPLETGALHYLGGSRTALPLSAPAAAELLLIGGEPFAEDLLMWWNFVGRTHEEIVQARLDWESGPGDRFAPVAGYLGDRLAAPALPNATLRARPRRPPTGG